MSSYIPIPLSLPLKYNTFHFHYQRVQNLVIEQNIQAIKKQLEKISPISVSAQLLYQESFWETLKDQIQNVQSFERLQHDWLMQKPLAHLNTKQLLRLYQDNLLPLERGYQYLSMQLQEKKITAQIKDNIKRLSELKMHILNGLWYRCQVHKILNAHRNTDEVLNTFVLQVNLLKGLEAPLNHNFPYSATLNDDRRLTIFDLLSINKFAVENLHETIVSPIPKRTHTLLKTERSIQDDLKSFYQYRNKVLQTLECNSANIFYIKNRFSLQPPVSFKKRILRQLKKWMGDWNSIPLFHFLFSLRFLLYTILLFLFCQYMLFTLQPIALLFISTKAFTLFSSVILYSLGIAPLWYKGTILIKKSYLTIIDYIIFWKKQALLDSLITLEGAEHFICSKLSHTILDLSHFDIQALIKDLHRCQTTLDETQTRLLHFAPGEKLFCKGVLRKYIIKTHAKIEQVKEKLKQHLQKFAAHIASTVGEEMELLDKSTYDKKLTTILSKKQLEYIAQFVYQYGSENIKKQFKKNTHIVKKWCDKIASGQFCDDTRNPTNQYEIPWGEKKIASARLAGWQIILDTFTSDTMQRQATIDLHKLLIGKKSLSIEALQALLAQLTENVVEQQILLKNVQQYLFETLNARAAQTTALLSTEQKNLIIKWYEKNTSIIHEAVNYMEQLCSSHAIINPTLLSSGSLNKKQLANYFELLDGADKYSYATGNLSALGKRHNSIRCFLENHQGENTLAYQLISFIPKKEGVSMIAEVARKRLSWMLNHLESIDVKNPFDPLDIGLFHNLALYESDFNFTQILQNSEIFKASWSEKVEHFFQACKTNGLDMGETLLKYLKNKQSETLANPQKNSLVHFYASENQKKEETRCPKYLSCVK